VSILTKNQTNILKNFNWLLGAYVYRFLIGFVSLAFVTRYLGPEKFGMFSYTLSLFSFAVLFLNLINDQIFKKEIIKSDNPEPLIRTYFFVRLYSALAVIAMIYLLLWIGNLETGDRRILLMILSFSLIFQSADVFSFYFSSRMKNEYNSKTEIVTVTGFNVVRILLAVFKSNLYSFAAAVIIQKIINFCMATYFYIKNYKIHFKSYLPDKDLSIDLMKKSLPLFFATLSTVIFYRIDQVMLGNMLNNTSVGIYSVVVKLTEPWNFIGIILMTSAYPIMIKSHENSDEDFSRQTKKILSLLLYTALGICLGTYIFSDIVIELLFSAKYMEAAPILRLQIISLAFLFWLNISNHYDVIVGATKITLFKTLFAAN